MPNPITNFRDSFGTDLGNKLITKEYLMSVYPQIAEQIITPELWVWGSNYANKLGTFSNTSALTPLTTFAGASNWKQVSASNEAFGAVKTDGTLWVWGRNPRHNLGINVSESIITNISRRCTPVTTFAGGTNWKQVSMGFQHTAAIKTDGTLWVWGDNQYGQLGNNLAGNTGQIRSTPITTFAGGTNWKQVHCGGNNLTVAIKTDGTLWVWGWNGSGELGINTNTVRCTPVTTFAGGTNWKQVFVGSATMAIKTDGTLWTWGFNGNGAVGDNTTTTRSTPVTTFAGGTNWKQVGTNMAIKTDGTLWTWGYNAYGDTLGINVSGNRLTPVTTFAGGTNWKQTSLGYLAAIKTDGTLWTWGPNFGGRLGINNSNTNLRINTPVTTFAGGTNWKQIAGGSETVISIRTSDDLQGI